MLWKDSLELSDSSALIYRLRRADDDDLLIMGKMAESKRAINQVWFWTGPDLNFELHVINSTYVAKRINGRVCESVCFYDVRRTSVWC